MVKMLQMAAVGVFAAFAAACLVSLATAQPQPQQTAATPENCHKPFCIIAFF